MNALHSMVVPMVTLLLAANLTRGQHWKIVTFVLGLVTAGCLVGVLQFSGARVDNPLLNDLPNIVSGNFANRNHFALFVSIGCLFLPAWVFRDRRDLIRRSMIGALLLIFFVLTIFATGSRMGTLVAVIAMALSFMIVRHDAVVVLRSLPRIAAMSIAASVTAAFISAVALSISLGRAKSIGRAFELEVSEDLRARALPFVLDAISRYFPVGSGFGTFDPIYRILEPDTLLQPAYFNRAHNDWFELVLDGGILSVALLAGAILWWLLASFRCWFAYDQVLPRLASSIILLVSVASLTDYPARTPMIMALLVLAGIWLAGMQNTLKTPTDATSAK